MPGHTLTQFILEFEHFADCIRQNRPPVYPPAADAEGDALGNARVVDAVFKSTRSGQFVRL